jgi:nucleoid-associated protein YgaU
MPAQSSPILYIVKEGDTLTSIAARELGDWRLWIDIADTNGLRDPDFLTIGQQVRMPDADV